MGEILPNKPLIEAIFEMRWKLTQKRGGSEFDPNYTFLIGLYYDKIKSIFPFKENLPSSLAPADMIPYIVQYRFRKSVNDWPLTQIGPGILTVNDTKDYSWENNFKDYCTDLILKFKASYPDSANLKVSELRLRYINAIEFNFEKEDVYKFLTNRLNLTLSLPSQIKLSKTININPYGFNLTFSLPVSDPKGANVYKISKGKKNNNDAIIFELITISKDKDLTNISFPFDSWLESAHAQTENSFYAFTEGGLLRSFKNEQ